MDKITKITGVYPIQLTHATGPEVYIQCQGEEISRALNELRERVFVLESQVNDLTKNHNELQANYWETESKVYNLEARNQLLGPDTSIATVKPKQKSDLEISNQNLQELFNNVGISAQEAYTALEDLTKWLNEDKKWY